MTQGAITGRVVKDAMRDRPNKPPQTDGRIYLSQIKGHPVGKPGGGRLGRLHDFAVSIDETTCKVDALIVRTRKGLVRLPAVPGIEIGQDIMVPAAGEAVPFDNPDKVVLLFDDVLDGEVIDKASARIVRVNDVALTVRHGQVEVAGVDASFDGILRRLAPRGFARHLPGNCIAWPQIEPAPVLTLYGSERRSCVNLARLHPSDVAMLVNRLPRLASCGILRGMPSNVAADVLEEVQADRRARLVEEMDEPSAVAILSAMAPDAAADVLQDIPTTLSDRLIRKLDAERQADMRLLLSYPHYSAGGLMTTSVVVALADQTVTEALAALRDQIAEPDLIYYVYIIDNTDDRHLSGVISLRDLLLAKPAQKLCDISHAVVRTVVPEQHGRDAARIMSEYNLLALPVVDRSNRLLGLITADDALDVLLPDSVRRRLPRFFS